MPAALIFILAILILGFSDPTYSQRYTWEVVPMAIGSIAAILLLATVVTGIILAIIGSLASRYRT